MNKPNYNEIIKTARKAKGLTQQELAGEAGVSLRTVQRIEKGTEEISGFSLRQICNVLDIPLEEIIMQNVNQISIDTNQIGSIRNLYLSSLCFVINPILGFLVPFIFGHTKQNKSELFVKHLQKITRFHGFYLLSTSLIFTLFLCAFYNDPFLIYKSIFNNQIISSLFIWQILIIIYLLYLPISLIWTIYWITQLKNDIK